MTSDYGGVELLVTYDIVASLEVRFVLDAQGIQSIPTETDALTAISVGVFFETVASESFVTIKTYLGGVVVDVSDFGLGTIISGNVDIRLFMSNNDIAVYVNDKFVYWYVLSSANWPDDPVVKLYAYGASCSLVSATRIEVEDKREAVWIDYESSSSSAIASIIQQRPLEIYPRTDRELAFTYGHGNTIVTSNFVKKIMDSHVENPQISSDGIVYSNDVSISSFEGAAEEEGLIVKMYRLAELDYGQRKAARMLQEKALEQSHSMGIIARFDPRLEIGDIFRANHTLTGTGTVVSFDAIIEDIRMLVAYSQNSMTLKGREDL